jgi:hypothetical protein
MLPVQQGRCDENRSRSSLCLILVLATNGSLSSAATITLAYNTPFSGTSPTGSGPWLTGILSTLVLILFS